LSDTRVLRPSERCYLRRRSEPALRRSYGRCKSRRHALDYSSGFTREEIQALLERPGVEQGYRPVDNRARPRTWCLEGMAEHHLVRVVRARGPH
jgi:hypothetical protein